MQKLGLRLLIQPAKGYSITVKRPLTSPSIPMHFSERKVIATPMGDELRFAGTLELAVRDGDLSERFGVHRGARVEIRPARKD